jgi:hypothetical protein
MFHGVFWIFVLIFIFVRRTESGGGQRIVKVRCSLTMGFETELYVQQPVDQNLMCNICHGVQDKPTVVCENGHTFCSACIQVWERHSDKCPACRSTICNKVLVHPLQNIIMSLEVRCPETLQQQDENEAKRPRVENTTVSKKGWRRGDTTTRCYWQGTLSDYLEKHRNRECRFGVVEYPLGCRKMLRLFDLEAHKENECECRIVTCTHCQNEFERRDLLCHQSYDCPKTMQVCLYCSEEILREELGKKPRGFQVDDPPEGQSSNEAKYTGHYKVCPKYLVKCEFHKQGCETLIKREDLAEHHATYARMHAKLVADDINRVRDAQRWSSIAIDWDIDEDVVNAAVVFSSDSRGAPTQNKDFVIYSDCIKVGDYKAFLRLIMTENEVIHMNACVYRPTFSPFIDRLELKCGDCLLTESEEQQMQRDRGERVGIYEMSTYGGERPTWSVGGALRYDGDGVERDATLFDILEKTEGPSRRVLNTIPTLKASFRLKSPEKVSVDQANDF